MTDVLLFDAPDGGDVLFTNGLIAMSEDGLDVAVYLSWFGGNEEDSGRTEHDAVQWWGNRVQPTPEHRYRSETQSIIQGLPLTSENLRALQDAAKRDLDWMVSRGDVVSVTTSTGIAGADEVILKAKLELPNGRSRTVTVRRKWTDS